MSKSLSDELVARQIQYWQQSSQYDLDSSRRLFDAGTYVWCLFVGHLALEKMLKALWVAETKTTPPRTHNLLVLAEQCNLEFTDQDKTDLLAINRFNIEARYPNIKLDFHRLCDSAFAEKHLTRIEALHDRFAQQLL